jgi:DNA-binding winged helix-turn-helix (wHTH) protein
MTGQHPHGRILRFSEFELDLERRELRRRGTLVPLPPQPLAMLEHLLANPGQVVTRDELRLVLWPAGVHVDHDRGLNYCVNRVRRALGDDARTPRFVETLPRRGYRFLAEVDVVRAGESGPFIRLHPGAPMPRVQERDPGAVPRSRVRHTMLLSAAALLLALQAGPRARHSVAGQPGLPSPRPGAQAAFQRGRSLLDEGPSGWRRSVAWFEEASRLDGSFALARYGLADA